MVGTKISPRLTKKGVFFMNFFDFDSFSQICPIFHHSPLFCAMRTDLSWKAINLWREHKNDGEWWKDRTNLWKAVKIKEIREKTPFLSNAEKSSPHQYNSKYLFRHAKGKSMVNFYIANALGQNLVNSESCPILRFLYVRGQNL